MFSWHRVMVVEQAVYHQCPRGKVVVENERVPQTQLINRNHHIIQHFLHIYIALFLLLLKKSIILNSFLKIIATFKIM